MLSVLADGSTTHVPGPIPRVATSYLLSTSTAARRAIEEGGAYLNNVKVADVAAVPDESDFLHRRFLVLRRGKHTVGGIELR